MRHFAVWTCLSTLFQGLPLGPSSSCATVRVGLFEHIFGGPLALRVSGANQKDLLLFAHLASEANLEDWICRVTRPTEDARLWCGCVVGLGAFFGYPFLGDVEGRPKGSAPFWRSNALCSRTSCQKYRPHVGLWCQVCRLDRGDRKGPLVLTTLHAQSAPQVSHFEVETDSYFAPANFRRFVRGRQLSPEEQWTVVCFVEGTLFGLVLKGRQREPASFEVSLWRPAQSALRFAE